MPEFNPNQKLATVAETAAALSISPDTLKRWVKQGKVPAPIKLGVRCVRYDVEAVKNALIASGGK